MRIDLVTGATYTPIRTTRPAAAEPKAQAQSKPGITAKTGNALLEGLTPDETAALQKLFGEFRSAAGKETTRTARPGQYIDITI